MGTYLPLSVLLSRDYASIGVLISFDSWKALPDDELLSITFASTGGLLKSWEDASTISAMPLVRFRRFTLLIGSL